MLTSVEYQLVHNTAPSHIQDIALTEESNTFPSDNDSGESTGGNIGLPTPHPQRGDSSRHISGEDVTIPLASKGYSHLNLSRRGQDAELEIVAQRAAEMAVARLTDYTAQIEGRLLVEKNDGWYQSMLGKGL